jgi:hypothetical protein
LLVECLDRVPVQLQLRRHILDCCRPTAPADIMGKSLGIERVDVGNSIPIAFAVLRLAQNERMLFRLAPKRTSRSAY